MFSHNIISRTGLALLGVVTFVAIGCGRNQTSQSDIAKPTVTNPTGTSPAKSVHENRTANSSDMTMAGDDEHAHRPGSNGGIIVPIGKDSYHAEVVIEKGGTFRLLTLGEDESRIQEVEDQPIKAYAKVAGDSDSAPVSLSAVPQVGDAVGKTSQFVGQLPEALRGKPLEVTIPNLRINGERFRVGFTTQATVHQEEMPASLAAGDEEVLYLTPAGKYTAADIAANGNLTAAQKFKGILSSHDMKPKAGDRICPITSTKANPRFSWTIDGMEYQFCCPPCVDEFVRIAKFHPDDIQSPDSYIK
jgi:hypothetical protein